MSLRDPDNGFMGVRGVRKILEARGRNQLGYRGRSSKIRESFMETRLRYSGVKHEKLMFSIQ